MAVRPCAVCGGQYDESELLFSDRGQICAVCELDLHAEAQLSRSAWSTILAGPLFCATGTAMFCLPGIGVVLVAIFAAAALMGSYRAIRTWLELSGSDEPGLGGLERALLLASGIFTIPWALGIGVASVIGTVGTAIWFFTG